MKRQAVRLRPGPHFVLKTELRVARPHESIWEVEIALYFLQGNFYILNKMYTHINKSTNALIHRGEIPRIKEDLEKYKVVAA